MSKRISLNINALQVSKLLFAIYVSYTNVLSWAGYYIPYLSMITLIGAIFALVSYDNMRIRPPWEITIFLAFALYALLSGIFVAVDYNVLCSAVITFVEYLASVYLIIRYTEIEKKPNFPMIVFVIQGVIASLLLTFNGVSVEQRATIAENINVNTIGMMAALSLAYLLYLFIDREKNPTTILINISLMMLLLFSILQTVSKKSIISALFIILLWSLCCFRSAFKRMNVFIRVFLYVSIAVFFYYAFMWYQGKFAEDYDFLLYRFDLITEGSSSSLRRLYIIDAFKTFFNHPIIGVGLNNYRFHNRIMQTYSHCFYSEICSCTGILGLFLFLPPIFSSITYIVRQYNYAKKNNYVKASQILFILCLVLVFAFICFTQIIFYEYNLMYFLGVLISYKYYLKNSLQ